MTTHRLTSLLTIASIAVATACSDELVPSIDAGAAIAGDNGITTCGKPAVFLADEGVTIIGGPPDALQNTDKIVAPGEVEVYEPVADRARADEVRVAVLDRLAELRIPAFTRRPAAVPFMMVVIDGEPTGWGGLGFSAAYDCDNDTPHDIAYVNFRAHERYGTSALVHAVLIVVGISAGLDATDRIAAPTNCMRADGIVSDCVFADGVTISAAYRRCSDGTQDQLVLLQAAHGC
ncbi:MAG: hypothetical protein K8M05_13250 [Deltaproteobacteria bacterium]|nr:hypothetical protein [Kofleriaceae bacterium]